MPEPISSKQLREKLREPVAVMRRLTDKAHAEKRKLTAEEDQEFNRAAAEYDAIESQIKLAERVEASEARLAAPAPGAQELSRQLGFQGGRQALQVASPEQQGLAFGAWMRYQAGLPVSPEEEAAADATGILLRSSWFDVRRPTGMRTHQIWSQRGVPNFGATMSEFTGASGGYTVPPVTLIRSLEQALLQYGGVRQVASVMTTATGEPVTWPTANDTGNLGRRIGESATQTTTATTNPTLGAQTWNSYAYTSDFILVPYGLLRDSVFNLPEIIGAMLGERVGRKTSVDFTTGNGAAAPSGIVTDATLGVTAASPTAIAADELFDLLHSVDPAYRGMGCGWMFHDQIFLNLRKLKDGEGNYLWQEGMSVGAPNMILGYPYAVNQQMASSIAASAKTILFGMFSAYKIRDVGTVRLRRVDERFAENDQVGFVYISYHDGHLLDAGTHPVKYLQQHS